MDQNKERDNNFGFLRLLFATLVIFSHSPGILYGNLSRDMLTRFWGTLSLGNAAVDGFFVISGYLVTKSFLQSDSLTFYLEKRIFRIYPGFLVSFWMCVLFVGPFVGEPTRIFSLKALSQQLANSLLLQMPNSAGAFRGMPYPELNNSMWTIQPEFGCYLATMCAGMAGLYAGRLRAVPFIGVSLFLVVNALTVGNSPLIRFAAVFGVGALYYVYRDRVQLTSKGAFLSALILFALMFNRYLAEEAVAIFGGYLIFWIAFKLPVFRLSKLDNKVDLSYGIYLYAWPIASVIAWKSRHINPWLLSAITFVCSAFVAYLSWTFVEKPSLALVRKGHRASVPVALRQS